MRDPDFGDGWETVEGEFVSVMCVVTPCRSDKSVRGVVPHAHIAGGWRRCDAGCC